MNKDLLKKFITKSRDLIANYKVMDVYNTIHAYFDGTDDRESADEAFSFICNGWVKHGHNPLEKMEFVPANYFTYINTPEVVIPWNIYSIHEGAFNNVKFDTVTINEGVRFISTGAFVECEINSIIVKSHIINIESDAFWHSRIRLLQIPRSAHLESHWHRDGENIIDNLITFD